MKDKIVIILLVLMAGIGVYGIYQKSKEVLTTTDAVKFSEEYDTVSKDNVFVYRSLSEINKILENGSGIVYLGFPECPWCKRYVVYLNEVAKDEGAEKIYYHNISEDRKNNTEEYQETVKLLEEYLQYDDEGNKKICVPAIIAVNKGEIVGFDDETAWDTKGFEDPKDYWTEDKVTALKTKLSKMIEDSGSNSCSDCNK